MRRVHRVFPAVILAAWLPVAPTVAGWRHHGFHGAMALPPMAGPAFGAPACLGPAFGPVAPWAGWEHAVVIDDRPLVAAPVWVADVPRAGTILGETILGETLLGETVVGETLVGETVLGETVLAETVIAEREIGRAHV